MYKGFEKMRGQLALWLAAVLALSILLASGVAPVGAAKPDAWDYGPADPPGTLFDIVKVLGVEDILLDEPNGVIASVGGVDCTYENIKDTPLDRALEGAMQDALFAIEDDWAICNNARGPELRGFMPGMKLGRNGRFLKAIQYVKISLPEDGMVWGSADLKFFINKEKYDPAFVRVLFAAGDWEKGLSFATRFYPNEPDADGVVEIKNSYDIRPYNIQTHMKWAIFYFGPGSDVEEYDYTYEEGYTPEPPTPTPKPTKSPSPEPSETADIETTLPSSDTPSPMTVPGDVNGDGKVNIEDILLIRDVIFGLKELNAQEAINVNVAADGKADINTILYIRDIIFGIK